VGDRPVSSALAQLAIALQSRLPPCCSSRSSSVAGDQRPGQAIHPMRYRPYPLSWTVGVGLPWRGFRACSEPVIDFGTRMSSSSASLVALSPRRLADNAPPLGVADYNISEFVPPSGSRHAIVAALCFGWSFPGRYAIPHAWCNGLFCRGIFVGADPVILRIHMSYTRASRASPLGWDAFIGRASLSTRQLALLAVGGPILSPIMIVPTTSATLVQPLTRCLLLRSLLRSTRRGRRATSGWVATSVWDGMWVTHVRGPLTDRAGLFDRIGFHVHPLGRWVAGCGAMNHVRVNDLIDYGTPARTSCLSVPATGLHHGHAAIANS